jgi:hypothetical protein
MLAPIPRQPEPLYRSVLTADGRQPTESARYVSRENFISSLTIYPEEPSNC